MVSLSLVNLLIAFIAGTLAFFAGCLLPIVPSYVSYLTGVAIKDPVRKKGKFKSKALITSIFFVLGFVGIFIFLGATVNTLARFLNPYRNIAETLGGLLIVILGLHLLEILRIPILYRQSQLRIDGLVRLPKGSNLSALVLGLLFGFTWTPCIGPVLATILLWVSQASTIWVGMILMMVFGLGLGLPFIIVGLAVDSLFDRIKKIQAYAPLIQKISGGILVVTGLLFIFGLYSQLAGYLLAHLTNWQLFLEFK